MGILCSDQMGYREVLPIVLMLLASCAESRRSGCLENPSICGAGQACSSKLNACVPLDRGADLAAAVDLSDPAPRDLGPPSDMSAPETCKAVEVRFVPQGFPAGGRWPERFPQLAVWVESPDGRFIADLYVTNAVGRYGIGNRPGQAFLKSDFRWPYGRRPMVLPVWAHRRGKSYGMVVMGGKCSTRYNPTDPKDSSCPLDFTGDPSDDDTTIVYHGPVSSPEPYFCSPTGWKTTMVGGVDVITCASSFYGSKGWYAPGYSSRYPPRADLLTFISTDHPDAAKFATHNDVVAISAATPANGKILSPPIVWSLPAAAARPDYVVRVEVNIEGDFNAAFPAGQAVPEPHSAWDYLGSDPFGQPSVVYSVPIKTEGAQRVFTTQGIEGYGDFRGASGTLTPVDATISTSGGSGADRLRLTSDGDGSWRIKVTLASCS